MSMMMVWSALNFHKLQYLQFIIYEIITRCTPVTPLQFELRCIRYCMRQAYMPEYRNIVNCAGHRGNVDSLALRQINLDRFSVYILYTC